MTPPEPIKARLAFVCPDGQGGQELRLQPEGGGQVVLTLTIESAARLQAQLATAIAEMAGVRKAKPPPPERPQYYWQR
jgi:hypothetical protein